MRKSMTEGSPLKLIIEFAIPVFIGKIFQMLYSTVDSIIVGRFIGTQALAAVGSTSPIGNLMVGFSSGLAMGFCVLTAQRHGAEDYDGVKKSVGNGIVVIMIIALTLTILGLTVLNKILVVMNIDEIIFKECQNYICVIAGGLCFTVLYNYLASALRAIGDSKTPLLFLIIASVFNVVLDLLFIVVFEFGVAGVAFATVISQGISGLLCLRYIYKHVPILCISKKHLKVDKKLTIKQINIGLPMAIQSSIMSLGSLIIQSALNGFGYVAVASYAAAVKIESLAQQVYASLGMTMAAYTAQNKGVNDYDRIKAGVKVANKISAIYALVSYGVMVFIMPYAMKLFITGDLTEVMQYANTYIIFAGACYIPLGMIFIYRNTLQGCGHSMLTMIGGGVETLVRIICAAVATYMGSYVGLCVSNGFTWLITGIYLFICYKYVINKLVREYEKEIATKI